MEDARQTEALLNAVADRALQQSEHMIAPSTFKRRFF